MAESTYFAKNFILDVWQGSEYASIKGTVNVNVY